MARTYAALALLASALFAQTGGDPNHTSGTTTRTQTIQDGEPLTTHPKCASDGATAPAHPRWTATPAARPAIGAMDRPASLPMRLAAASIR